MKFLLLVFLLANIFSEAQTKRARDYGIPFDGTPGRYNAITDVGGVTVGHATIKKGNGALVKALLRQQDIWKDYMNCLMTGCW